MDELILVDHNKLSRDLAHLSSSVSEIVDHHKDMGEYHKVSGDRRNIAFEGDIATAGSVCTLIFEKYTDANSSFSTSLLDDTISTLLMGVIALDTQNMSPEAGKGTKRDENALKYLQNISSQNIDTLFTSLRDAKSDPSFWLSLSAEDCLRLDFKAFTTATSTNIG